MGFFSDIIGTLSSSFNVGKLTLSSSALSVARTVTFPDKAGTVAMIDDVSGGSITSAAAITTTSGTSHDFTGIPAGVKRITVMFSGVSINGSSQFLIQIGDSGGIETTGYSGGGARVGGTAISAASTTAGFYFTNVTAATLFSGSITIVNLTGNVWSANGILGGDVTENIGFTAGGKTLSATLDRIRLTTVNGTDTFDSGSINIMYE